VPVFSCGTSLCIDWRMVVVVVGNDLHHEQREGKLPGRWKCPGNMSEGEMSSGNVLHFLNLSVRSPVSKLLNMMLRILMPNISHPRGKWSTRRSKVKVARPRPSILIRGKWPKIDLEA